MKTIAIISQKGGAGKTTLALHLATASVLAGYNTAIIDLASLTSPREFPMPPAPALKTLAVSTLPLNTATQCSAPRKLDRSELQYS
ncbi:ParA family protein [Lutimaribacter marinistellae]|uniref:ParA family protein n=1 Tax=Lutimaribacter marinistellae TaxID=1820329 RepID=A0ABV7TJ32_9RHOB